MLDSSILSIKTLEMGESTQLKASAQMVICAEFFISEKLEKIFKKFEKTLKKVLTNGYGCDILHERSKRECKKQRSLKIEQQIERTK